MTADRLAEIRARAEAATEGPWETRGYEQMPGKYVVGPRKAGDLGRGPVILMQPLFCDERSAANAEFIAHARADIPALLAEVERLRSERDRAREECGHEKHMRKFVSDERDDFIAAKMRAEADRDDMEDRLSLLLWELTDGKLSKPGYDVRTMVSEVEAVFERNAEEDRAELQAERDRLAATVDRVRALHAPRTVQVITGDCSTEECGHEDECPTVPFRQCVECDRIADEIDTYYSERGVAPTEWPCPTIAAIEGADS